MLMSELIGKEIININDGNRMGFVGDSDLVINPNSGEIESIILPNKGNFVNIWVERQKVIVPWEAVRKIGREVIVVDLDTTHIKLRNHSF